MSELSDHTLTVAFTHLAYSILTTTSCSRYGFHFADVQTEAQSYEVTWTRSITNDPRLGPREPSTLF